MQGLQEPQVHKVQLAHRDNKAQQEMMVLQGRKGHKEMLAMTVQQVQLVLQDRRAQQDRKAQQVQQVQLVGLPLTQMHKLIL